MREEADGPDRFRCAEGPFDHYERTLLVAEAPDGLHLVSETIDWELAIPLWGGLFRPLLGRQLRRTEPPAPPPAPGEAARSSPWWSPPTRLDARSARILGLLCGVSMIAGYLGTIITQTITFASDEFGTGRSAQGATLGAVRVGVLLSLVLVALSDRQGRRKLLVRSAVGGAVAAALGALSPNLWVLGGTQTVSRAFSTALGILIVVVAAEEMPAGGRAYAASVLAMTAALGAGGAVILLPLADTAEWAWRIIYVVPLLALPLFLRVARQIPESRRFVRPHGKATLAGHRGRLALLSASSFFGLMFLAPTSQFQNEFLRDEQGFPAILITIFTLSTNTPAGLGIVVGGRIADLRGRRLVGTVGTLGGAALFVAAYQSSGPALWVLTLLGTVIAASTVPALGVYGPELFPTALRGRANGITTLAGVMGSGTGLALEGWMADRWDRIGPGIAVLGVGPVIVALLVVFLYPETANLELEELNPEDAATAIAPPML